MELFDICNEYDQWRDDNGWIWFPVAEHEWDMEGTSQYVWYDDPSYINY